MIPQFSREDVNSIFHYIAKMVTWLGIIMLIPMFIGIINKEWGPSIDFIISSLFCICAGSLLGLKYPFAGDLNWRQGMSLVALCWILAMFMGAVPLFLSGHYNSFLDASFEAMSGFTTTGLTLVNNLDYMAASYNFWRHSLCFIGGQGIILVAMTLFVKGGSALKVYMGEGREEKIMPNMVQTARFIWLVSFTYLIIGTTALFFLNFTRDMSFGRSLLHAICLFMSGWGTGGFVVQSQNILYYHSPAIEMVTGIIFLIGSVNFGVHYAVWTGKPRELVRNYELKVYMLSVIVLSAVISIAFMPGLVSPGYFALFRETFYQVIAAHTSVGYSNILPVYFHQWPTLAIFGIILAMVFGGSSSSTAGGVKMLRVGIFLKGFKKEIRRLTSPESAVIVERFHHIKDVNLEDNHIKMATIIILLYLSIFVIGTFMGLFYGYPLQSALFESVSAGANAGLSMGVTSPSMPAGLKVVYMIQMWLGRLEFISVFVLLRFIMSLRSPQ